MHISAHCTCWCAMFEVCDWQSFQATTRHFHMVQPFICVHSLLVYTGLNPLLSLHSPMLAAKSACPFGQHDNIFSLYLPCRVNATLCRGITTNTTRTRWICHLDRWHLAYMKYGYQPLFYPVYCMRNTKSTIYYIYVWTSRIFWCRSIYFPERCGNIQKSSPTEWGWL